MKILITGVTAFVGSHLADYLIDEEKLEVYGIRRPRSRDEFTRKEITYHEADVADYTGVSAVVKKVKPDFLFHLAAQSDVALSWKAPSVTIATNVLGTLNVLEAVRHESPDTIIHFAGSSEEYGLVQPNEVPIKETNPLRPMSPYGVSKVAADLLSQQYCKSYGIKVVVTRGFNHTGPRRGEFFATSSFAKQIAEIEGGRDPVIYVGNLEAQRDWTDVRDMVKAYWLAASLCPFGKPFNICSGRAVKVGDMLNMLLGMASVKIQVEQDEARMRPSDVPILLGDSGRFREATGWEPKVPFEETLEDLLDYWRERV